MQTKVLIVDDSSIIQKEPPTIFLKNFPNSIVHKAASFSTAEKFLKQNQYHIVMLDGLLSSDPNNSDIKNWGHHLIETIKISSPKAVIVTISNDEQYRTTAMLLGADVTLSKEWFLSESGERVINSLGIDFSVEDGM